ncbi:hypothetical protein ACF3OH_02080 [Chryseomicrobium aureum]|uniref:hypothetical protein n=1 Tax=Chryseomicrobium aureum TaxID=1441723 RepID=UPI00370DCB32
MTKLLRNRLVRNVVLYLLLVPLYMLLDSEKTLFDAMFIVFLLFAFTAYLDWGWDSKVYKKK